MDLMVVDPDPLYTRLFARAPIYDLILSCLSARSLVLFARTCKVVYDAVVEYRSRAFNINRHFSRYFNDPVAFRCLQARTNTLVSGSDALQFFDRSYYSEADLDIYTHPGHSYEVAQFLVEVEDYHYVPRDDDDDEPKDWKEAIGDDWDGTQRRVHRTLNAGYPLSGISGVWTFQKAGPKQESKVQVIEAASSPVEAILDFHSTCVMNFISSDAAYSLYPMATLEDRKSLCMPHGRHSPRAIEKYVQRGWRVYCAPAPDDIEDRIKPPFMLDKERWVGDADTWVIPLDQTGIQQRLPLSKTSAPIKFDLVRLNGWRLKPCNKFTELAGYETHAYRLQSTVFRYNYAIPIEKLSLAIRDWANVQGRLNHQYLSKEDWVWFDADLPGFLRKACVSL